jgi:hypothetical protein
VVTAAIGLGVAAGGAALMTGLYLLHAGWLAPLAYGAGVVAASLVEGRTLSWRARAWLPAVLATIHLSWGAGFLFGRRPVGSHQ